MKLYPATPRAAPFGSTNAPPSGRYELNGAPVPSVTEILRDVGLGLDARRIPPDLLEAKGRIGTLVHAEIARILTEGYRLRLYEERVMGYLWSWLDWYRQVEPFEIVACETSFVPSGVVAGTMDVLGRRISDGRWILYDWKTREPKRFDGFQLAGYLGLAALHPSIPYHASDLRKTDRVIVSLREWKKARVKVYDDPHDFEVFRAACVLWHARRKPRR